MDMPVRIAVRQAATELTDAEIGMVSGGMMAGTGTVMNDSGAGVCRLDATTDCWVSSGAIINNDDAN